MTDPSIDAVLAEPAEAAATPTTPPARPRRPLRPNYNLIHQYPLPVRAHPLPPLFPHNPLSYIHVACTYLVQLFWTPSSHPQTPYNGYFSPDTRSVHVTDEMAVRVLWEMGFFGKGSLSRSEPEWINQEQKRRGAGKKDTAGEITRRRREERRQFKLDRARREQEALKSRLQEEASSGKAESETSETITGGSQNGHLNGHLDDNTGSKAPVAAGRAVADHESDSELKEETLNGHILTQPVSEHSRASSENDQTTATRDDVSTKSSSSSKTVRFSPTVERLEFEIPTPVEPTGDISLWKASKSKAAILPIRDEEHLQLTYEEAFFLVYGLGVLQVFDEDRKTPIPTIDLLRRSLHSVSSTLEAGQTSIMPDDPFLLSYVVYHHFRSLGWVVRSGIKFSVDYLLYYRGPAFAHAEFAVIILPSYGHSYWRTLEAGREKAKGSQSKSWWWLHCVNRVQTSVQKNLVLCYVDIPPPKETKEAAEVDIGELLRGYKVREVNVRRWTPNRMRD